MFTVVWILKWLWKTRMQWKTNWRNNLLTILKFGTVLYFLFHFLWGTNYHRTSLDNQLGLQRAYTPEQLINFTEKLIAETNQLHLLITKNDSLPVVNPHNFETHTEIAYAAYAKIANNHPFLTYKNKSVKKSLISTPLSYMGYSGYFNPFTNEAQVNSNIPKYNFPTTTLHEMSHQLGFASESEANFVGYLASVSSDDIYFQYSGHTFALKYCMKNILNQDEILALELFDKIHYGIRENFKETDAFLEKYDSPVAWFFKYFYHYFLKFNQQKDGLMGYNNYVGLMINYDINEKKASNDKIYSKKHNLDVTNDIQ
jgi:hypothetical protein